LYYCVDWDIVSFNISDVGLITNLGADLSAKTRQKYNFIEDNRKITFEPFYINPEYAEFLRYPYIDRFIFNGGIAALDDQAGWIPILVRAEMYKTCVKVRVFFGFFALLRPIFGDCSSGTNDYGNVEGDTIYKEAIWNSCVAPYITGEKTVPDVSTTGTTFWLDKFCRGGTRNSKTWTGGWIGGAGFNNTAELKTEGDYPDPRDYHALNGAVDGYNFDSSSSTTYYDCLSHAKLESWPKEDFLHAGDFCYNSEFCEADNQDHPEKVGGCKSYCEGILTSDLDDTIEKCVKEYIEQYNDQTKGTKSIFDKFGEMIGKIFGLFGVEFKEDDKWGGFGVIGFSLKGLEFGIVFPATWSFALESLNTQPLINLILNFIDKVFVDYGVAAVKIITDEDNKYKGQLVDPDPQVSGNILVCLVFKYF
jgi:hypothetical protein